MIHANDVMAVLVRLPLFMFPRRALLGRRIEKAGKGFC